MAKYKTFGELEEKSYVFMSEIQSSALKQNCVGQIYSRYAIQNIATYPGEDKLTLTLALDKSQFIKGFNVDKDKTEIIVITVKADESIKVYEPRIEINRINVKILATNIEEIKSAIRMELNKAIVKANEFETISKNMMGAINNIEMNFKLRKDIKIDYAENNLKPQYQEVVTTEEVYV